MLAALAAAGSPTRAAARQAVSPGQPSVWPIALSATREDPTLIFEREVFVYPTENRRDPFKPLGQDGLGPMFEDVTLRMIIFSEVAGESVVVLADRSRRTYRLRRGQRLGNATVVSITPTRAVFVVEDYGNRRQEVLDLRPNTEMEGA